jgi:hypothetical protein
MLIGLASAYPMVAARNTESLGKVVERLDQGARRSVPEQASGVLLNHLELMISPRPVEVSVLGSEIEAEPELPER